VLSIAQPEARMMAQRWERECLPEWAARSVNKLHPQLAQMDVAHVTRVEGPDGSAGGQQLTLT
jgi:hypothetical protein